MESTLLFKHSHGQKAFLYLNGISVFKIVPLVLSMDITQKSLAAPSLSSPIKYLCTLLRSP